MEKVNQLPRETLIDYLVKQHGYDWDVLTNFCSDEWIVEIAERQLFANPDEEEEEEFLDEPDIRILEAPKSELREEITDSVEEFLNSGGEIEVLNSVNQEAEGEAGTVWAKEICSNG
jgi:6-phosphogluconolactonase/glucosamine-6-phosphate isomerase/deaminase